MKTVSNCIIFSLMLCCNLITAQSKPHEYSLETIPHLMSARRFPYTGKIDITQNYPNPFSLKSSTIIRFKAIDVFSAQLFIYSPDGEIIQQINLEPGVGQIVLEGEKLASGLYMYALMVNGRRMAARKMLVVDDDMTETSQ